MRPSIKVLILGIFSLLYTTPILASDIIAKEGVLDLREWNYEESEIIELKGEWNFYWGGLYTLSDIEDSLFNEAPTQVNTSVSWTNFGFPAHGNATYHLKLLLPQDLTSLGLRVSVTNSQNRVYVGDVLFSETGYVSNTPELSIPYIESKVVYIPISSSEVDLFVQIGNFSHKRAGMIEMFSIGTPESIMHQWSLDIMQDLFLFGALLIMGLYHIGIFALRRKDPAPLFFAFFCIVIAIRTIFTRNYIVNEVISLDFETTLMVNYLTFYLGGLIFSLFSYYLYPDESHRNIIKFSVILSTIVSITVMLTPSHFYTNYLIIYQVFTLFLGLYFTVVLIKASLNKQQGAVIFLCTWILLFLCIIYDILAVMDHVPDGDYAAKGLFVFIFAQSYLLSARFSNAFKENEELSEQLNYTNQNLELLVDEKTLSLQKANDQLSVQHDNIQDSIKYAKRIQDSILSNQPKIDDLLTDGFIYFQPRDKVSGDFFWTERVGNKSIVIAADCTGHGVPGAFMSLIGFEGLNQVILQKKQLTPSAILHEMHLNIRKTLNQEGNLESRDGMDMAVCIIDYDTNKILFGGAKRPLYSIKNGQLEEIKGDKLPIGGQYKGQDRVYATHEIQGDPEAFYYICSDGYQDQFGGKDDRKFMVGKFKKLLISIAEENGAKQKKLLERRFKSWRRGQKQVDDILVLGFKI